MMPAGIVRGALSRMGLIDVVVPEMNNLPQCMYPPLFSWYPFAMNRLQLPNRYISDKATKTFVNRLSLPMCSHIDTTALLARNQRSDLGRHVGIESPRGATRYSRFGSCRTEMGTIGHRRLHILGTYRARVGVA